MLNLLGDAWIDAADGGHMPPFEAVLALSGVHLHLYGKQKVQRGRKMGHITITAATADEVQDKAARVARALGLPYERL